MTSTQPPSTATHSRANGNGHCRTAHQRHGPEEVTITRRLYRSGESEYLIDGRAARLRDIQDLFMGTGLGPESYAIIEQGRIGQILSSKPAGPPRGDRRSRRHHQVQDAQAPGRSQAGRRQAEPGARVRHSRRSHPPGEFAQAAGLQSPALRRAEGGDGERTCAVVALRQVPLAGARRRQDGARPEPGRRPDCRSLTGAGGRARSRSTHALQDQPATQVEAAAHRARARSSPS